MKHSIRMLELDGAKLLLYVGEIKKILLEIQDAPWWERNPYIHSSKINKKLKQLELLVFDCIHTLISYTSHLSKFQICTEEELYAYYFQYSFLFQFRDPVIKQEYIYQILIKDKKLLSKFSNFCIYSNQFVKKQNQKLDEIIL